MIDEEKIIIPSVNLNPVTVLKDITKLVSEIKRNDQKKINEINEMKQLRLLISDINPVRSVTACQGLLSLVEDEVLSPMQAISMLVSAFSNIQNFSGVTAALAVLLRWDMNTGPKPYKCRFSLYANQHPLITLLKQRNNTWSDVFRLMQNFLFHPETNIKEDSISLLKPLLLFVLCDPQVVPHLPPESRQKTWTLMLSLLHDPSIRQLVIQSVPWFQISEECRCVEAGMLLLDLCESALHTLDGPLCLALAPLAAASIRTLVTRGADPEPSLAVLIRLLRVSPNAASCVMLLLADTITICPATYLASIVKSCREVFELHACSKVSVYSAVSSLLLWLASPSILTRDALQLATEFLLDIRNAPPSHWDHMTSRLCANAWFRLLRHSFENVHEAAELCRINESWRSQTEADEWLNLVKTSSSAFIARFSPFFCSLLIYGPMSQIKDDELNWPALSTLLWLVENQPEVSGRVTLTLLYQLAQEKRPLHQLALLRAIAVMGKHEENMVLILSVLKSLSLGGCYSSTTAIDLYLRVWKVQPRAYRFLFELLTTPFKGDDPDLIWELNVAKAAAIKEICCSNPDAHGSELVPLLSQLLTQCATPEGSVASALAVQGIASLCRAGIMDVASTWRGLAPKLRHDKRPQVIVSLCELLSVVSCLPTTTGKFDDFISDVIVTLWSWAQHSNGQIANASLDALADFHLDQLTLKGLPAVFRKNLKLPPAFCKTPIDAKRDPVDVLPYIPGECWKQVLEGLGVQEDRRDAVCNLLASWMRHEVKLFHRGLYEQSPSKPEPTSYQHLHESSILRAMFSLAYQGKQGPVVAALALNVLAKEFPKPLPPVTWNFLEEKLKEDLAVRKCCLQILAKQCKSSASANRILLNTIGLLNPADNLEDCKTLFSLMTKLGEGIPPNYLGNFVHRCLVFAVEQLKDRDVGDDGLLLKMFVSSIKFALQSRDIHEANISALASITEKLMENMDVYHPIFETFVDCALILPSKNIERLTSPTLWWNTSPEKILSAIRISCGIAMAQDSDVPLAAFNECIDVCTAGDSLSQKSLLEEVINAVKACRSHESNPRWLLQMLGRIQAIKANQETDKEQKLQILQSSCDTLMVVVIALAGHDILAGDSNIIVSSSQDRMLLFPQALLSLLNSDAKWEILTSQVIEWLHDMSLSSEVPSLLAQTFRLAIAPLRYHHHFKKSHVWMRILSS